MDPIVIVIIIVIGMPLGVILGLAKASQLRGPLSRPESKRPVEALVTEAIPEERPAGDDEDGAARPDYEITSPPPDQDPGLERHGANQN